jgi:hypothetical protein
VDGLRSDKRRTQHGRYYSDQPGLPGQHDVEARSIRSTPPGTPG